ncbi:hypothetical protein EW146_g442 [Bondarzewia mesenterica]|uniref:ATP synthase subunit d, mitochondrial n=1 Tax=Bondarzewia mesenterica TaxID=1095465 RepID=A0A4S4M966_9AGAM|nr:hypothetical protein EW146_g442 [Bondarzewia mesenterica]
MSERAGGCRRSANSGGVFGVAIRKPDVPIPARTTNPLLLPALLLHKRFRWHPKQQPPQSTSPASTLPSASAKVLPLPLPTPSSTEHPKLTPTHDPTETVASLQAFRKRHADAQLISAQLSAQPATVDLAHYRSVLKNKAIVDEAEKILASFKPVTYDVSTHVKAIETFEIKAVAKAQETAAQIDVELKDLQATLANIEEARPFEDLTVRHLPPLYVPQSSSPNNLVLTRALQVEEVGQAHPRILEAVETMVKKGKWSVPGYKEKFGDFSLM